MIPVIGASPGKPALDRIAHDRQQLRLLRIDGIHHFHQGNGVDAGIRITPVGFETGQIVGDRIVQMVDDGRLPVAARLLPAVLVDPLQDAVGLTGWGACHGDP